MTPFGSSPRLARRTASDSNMQPACVTALGPMSACEVLRRWEAHSEPIDDNCEDAAAAQARRCDRRGSRPKRTERDAQQRIHVRPQRQKAAAPADRMKTGSRLADLLVSQVWTNDFEQAIRGRTRREEADVLAVSAHQVDKASVINHIDSPVRRHVLGIVSLVGIRHCANLFSCACKTYEARMKCRDISG